MDAAVAWRPWELPPLPGESPAALSERRNQAYFAEQQGDVVEWWSRMGGGAEAALAGTRVIDFGCGHGALALDAARKGAAEVLGIDLDRERIGFAAANLERRYPDLREQVRFAARDIADVAGDGTYDLVLSKDTFEHVEDLPAVVRQFERLLRPGGRLLAGFSPLYYSPWGDHDRLWYPVPWMHALLPEAILFPLASRRKGERIRSAADVGLNKLTPAGFRALFAPDRWRVERVRYNPGRKRLLAAMRALRRLPLLEPLFTVGIYARLVRL